MHALLVAVALFAAEFAHADDAGPTSLPLEAASSAEPGPRTAGGALMLTGGAAMITGLVLMPVGSTRKARSRREVHVALAVAPDTVGLRASF